MQKVLDEVRDDRLKAYIVWLPILPTDNRNWAETRSGEFSDDRLSYCWDGDRITGKAWQSILDIRGVAWDI